MQVKGSGAHPKLEGHDALKAGIQVGAPLGVHPPCLPDDGPGLQEVLFIPDVVRKMGASHLLLPLHHELHPGKKAVLFLE